jgi:hypothetical protein
MEMATNPTFGDMNVGTAGDHFRMSFAHLRQGLALLLGGGGTDVTYRTAKEARAVDDDDEVQDSTVIFPTDNWKETWDLWVLVLILYSAVMVPYRICFNSPAVGVVFWGEQLVTLSFIVDVFFNFNTAYLEVRLDAQPLPRASALR